MLKMKNVTISPLTKQDIWEICLVHKLCFIETYMDLLDVNSLIKNELLTIENYWNRKINNKEITSYKVLFNDKIIGFFSFGKSRKESIAAYEIFTFYILQEFQKQGIGTYVFKHLLEDKTDIYVEVFSENKNACLFYEKINGKKHSFFYDMFESKKMKTQIYIWEN